MHRPWKTARSVDAGGKRIVLLSDHRGEGSNLAKMVKQMGEILGGSAELINLHEIDMNGGCLGCLRYGYDYRCAYEGKDEYIDVYNRKIRTADVIVFAGSILDRYLSSRWKLFFNRSFFNTHMPSLSGKQFCFLVSGPLRELPNLMEILSAYTEFQRANLVGFVTDEEGSSEEIDCLLEDLAERAVRYAAEGYVQPRTFLGIGGTKIFRDEIWGRIRFPFLADHRYYKENGFYGFPKRDLRSRFASGIMWFLTRFPRLRREIYAHQIVPNIVKAHRKVLKEPVEALCPSGLD